MARYTGRWGSGITEAYLPQDIVKDGVFSLDADALAVLAVLFDTQRGQASARETYGSLLLNHMYATARISRKRLEERTGYSVNVITAAIRKLKDGGWIEQSINSEDTRNKGGKFPCAEYTLINPKTGALLKDSGRKNVLLAHNLRYFTYPKVMLTKSAEHWSLAQMSSSQKLVYFACAFLANKERANRFMSSVSDIKTLTVMDPRTVSKCLDALEERGLIWTMPRPDGVSIELCDPFTGQPLEEPDEDEENNEVNYKVLKNGVSRRAVLNLTPQEVEKLVRSLVPAGDPVTVQDKGDLFIRCPSHPDDNPSCSVSPSKRGIWQCFGCKASGNLSDLIMRFTGVSKVESMKKIGNAAKQDIYFQRPDSEATIYTYRDEKLRTLKQVLRYPNNEDGTKVIRQRQRVQGGYKWDVTGLPPMLYHADLLFLHSRNTVCVVEGEKDADTITRIGIHGEHGRPVIGVTSGGANTWDSSLARHLRFRRVILLPDDDEAGRRYAEDVKASLEAEGIEYREVSFAGTGAKDVTDFLAKHSLQDLVQLIGNDWVCLPGTDLVIVPSIPLTEVDDPTFGAITF